MNEGGAPLPRVASLMALPESVQNSFRAARAEGTRGVDIEIGDLSPFIDCYRLVPHTPNESGLFLRTLAAPGVSPVNVRVSRQYTSPLRPAKVDRHVGFPELVPGELQRELEEWNPVGPGVLAGVEIKQLDGTVKEEDGGFVVTSLYLDHSNLLHDTHELVFEVEALLESDQLTLVNLEPVGEVWDIGKGSRGRVH